MNRNARRVFDGRRVSHLMRFDTPWRGRGYEAAPSRFNGHRRARPSSSEHTGRGREQRRTARQRDGARAVEFSMTDYFQRQLAYYADAHRDQVNSVMRIIGNPLLLVAMVWNAPLEADRIRRQF